MNYDNSVIRRRDRLPDVPRACLVITGEKNIFWKKPSLRHPKVWCCMEKCLP